MKREQWLSLLKSNDDLQVEEAIAQVKMQGDATVIPDLLSTLATTAHLPHRTGHKPSSFRPEGYCSIEYANRQLA
jgi:hypothetical protein